MDDGDERMSTFGELIFTKFRNMGNIDFKPHVFSYRSRYIFQRKLSLYIAQYDNLLGRKNDKGENPYCLDYFKCYWYVCSRRNTSLGHDNEEMQFLENPHLHKPQELNVFH